MKPIKINTENQTSVMAAIREAEGRATARIFWFAFIDNGIAEAEAAIEHLPKAYRAGVVVRLETGARVPNSYKGPGHATEIEITWRGGNWCLTKVERAYARSTSFGRGVSRHVLWIRLTQEQADKLAESHRRANRIQVTQQIQQEVAA